MDGMDGMDDWRWGERLILVEVLATLLFACAGCGPKDAPVQSDIRAYNLPLVDTVKAAGSDLRSSWFQRKTLPYLITYADKEYTHNAVVDHFNRLIIDPAKLKLVERGRVRVYFVGEGSGYKNSLGINLEGTGVKEGNPRILFPNANAPTQLDVCARLVDPKTNRLDMSKLGPRTNDTPLWPGDFVDLGTLAAGTQLSFFLTPNDGHVYTPIPALNPDGIPHMVATGLENSRYLLASFEDMFQGGDADYEDCVFVVEMSASNVEAIIGKIDPWRRIKQLVFVAAVLAIVIGGPVSVIVIKRYMRRRREARALDEATQFLQAAQPRDALKRIRSGKKTVKAPELREPWSALEISACEMLGDVAGLAQVYEEAPGLFSERENPALEVARAQVEAGRFEDFEALREMWRTREGAPGAWLSLDADVLMQEDQDLEAHELLATHSFEGKQDCGRLARLAFLDGKENPGEAFALLKRAAELDPVNPDAYLYRAALLELHGRLDEALAAYRAALKCAPKNLFVKDRLAEFHCRRGDYAGALRIWGEGLEVPTMDFVWLKVLFWGRIACPLEVAWEKLERPPGALRPLVDFVLQLPPESFWDNTGFTSVAESHPHFNTRQDVFWLRLLQALREGHEVEALWLLTFQGFDRRSWRPDLEAALARILTYRRSGISGAIAAGSGSVAASPESLHPFFAELESAMRQDGHKISDATRDLVMSEYPFAAACLAAGWYEAALRLLRSTDLPPESPAWMREAIEKAIAQRSSQP